MENKLKMEKTTTQNTEEIGSIKKQECQTKLKDKIKRPPHPDCKMSLDELQEMSKTLPNRKLRTNFVFSAYRHGADPHKLLKTMLTLPVVQKVLVDPAEIGHEPDIPKKSKRNDSHPSSGSIPRHPAHLRTGSGSVSNRGSRGGKDTDSPRRDHPRPSQGTYGSRRVGPSGPPRRVPFSPPRRGRSSQPGGVRSSPPQGVRSSPTRSPSGPPPGDGQSFKQQCQRLISNIGNFGATGLGIFPLAVPGSALAGPDTGDVFHNQRRPSRTDERQPRPEDRRNSNQQRLTADLRGVDGPLKEQYQRLLSNVNKIGGFGNINLDQNKPSDSPGMSSSGAGTKRKNSSEQHTEPKRSRFAEESSPSPHSSAGTQQEPWGNRDGSKTEHPPHPNCRMSKDELKEMSLRLPSRRARSKFIYMAYRHGEDPDQLMDMLLRETRQVEGTRPAFSNEPPGNKPAFNNGPTGNMPAFSNGPTGNMPAFNNGPTGNMPAFNSGPTGNMPAFNSGPPGSLPLFNNFLPGSMPPFHNGAPGNVPPFSSCMPVNVPQSNIGPPGHMPPFSSGLPVSVAQSNIGRSGEILQFNNCPPGSMPPFNIGPPGYMPPFSNGPPGNVPPFNNVHPGNMPPFNQGHPGNMPPNNNGSPGDMPSLSNEYHARMDRRIHMPPVLSQEDSSSHHSSIEKPHDRPSATDSFGQEDPTSPMFIVPTIYPSERFSDLQMDAVENAILDAILEIDDERLKPTFQESFRNNGRYGVICNDQLSKNWLFSFLSKCQPWPYASFKIISAEPTKIKAFAKLPLCRSDDNDKILKFIAKQNTKFNVSLWEVVRRLDSDSSTSLILNIDEESAILLKDDKKINFKMGRAEVIVEEGYRRNDRSSGANAGRNLIQQTSQTTGRPSCEERGIDEQPNPWNRNSLELRSAGICTEPRIPSNVASRDESRFRMSGSGPGLERSSRFNRPSQAPFCGPPMDMIQPAKPPPPPVLGDALRSSRRSPEYGTTNEYEPSRRDRFFHTPSPERSRNERFFRTPSPEPRMRPTSDFGEQSRQSARIPTSGGHIERDHATFDCSIPVVDSFQNSRIRGHSPHHLTKDRPSVGTLQSSRIPSIDGNSRRDQPSRGSTNSNNLQRFAQPASSRSNYSNFSQRR